MAHTFGDEPYEIWKETAPEWRKHGYPEKKRGAWPGRGKYTTTENRRFRHMANRAVEKGEEIPVRKRNVDMKVW